MAFVSVKSYQLPSLVGGSVLSGLTTSRELLQCLAVVAVILHKILPEESMRELGWVIFKAVGFAERVVER